MQQDIPINYDESKVKTFTLPQVLRLQNGNFVQSIEQWRQRRKEILQLFSEHVYGLIPVAKPISISLEESADGVFEGLGKRRQYKITVQTQAEPIEINLLLYLPTAVQKPGIFLGLNFPGNQAVCDDPAIELTKNWVFSATDDEWLENNRANEKSRGIQAGRWQVRKILENGYGLATAYYGDICPDNHEDFYNRQACFTNHTEKQNSTGAVSIWAWGLMRIMDALEKFNEIDSARVIVMGHSRLGKTSLWAAAQDGRFAAAISNDSGCGGSALSRRNFGETIEFITSFKDYWFCPKFKEYANNEVDLPVDQHMLLALTAPRPLLITSAIEDTWADPKGEFLSACYATEAYKLFGYTGISQPEMPPVKTLIGDQLCYHIRPGGHDVKEDDWNAFLKFASNLDNPQLS